MVQASELSIPSIDIPLIILYPYINLQNTDRERNNVKTNRADVCPSLLKASWLSTFKWGTTSTRIQQSLIHVWLYLLLYRSLTSSSPFSSSFSLSYFNQDKHSLLILTWLWGNHGSTSGYHGFQHILQPSDQRKK